MSNERKQSDPDFRQLRVVSLESRRADDMVRLIEKNNGVPFVSPSMKEVPLENNQPSVDLAHRITTGEVDIVIFMTGVGFKHFVEAVKSHVPTDKLIAALSDIITIARGPKPVAAMKEFGLSASIKVPEPNTWRELLETVDEFCQISQQHIAIQEYGKPNASLVAGLEARGAKVTPVRVYRWELPDDTNPLADNIGAICRQERDVVMFTSAHQLTNMLHLAEQLDSVQMLRDKLDSCVITSIGPTTTEALRHNGITVDLEPEHPKMGPMVVHAARESNRVIKQKEKIRVLLTEADVNPTDKTAPWYNSPFMKACRGEPTDVTPVWLMRQAGRYMQEYREVRAKTTFLELCKNPQLCAEVMLTAVTKLGVDAAIIFSDLLPILEPMGLDLEFAKGEGPVIHNPIRESTDINRVLELETVDSLDFVMQTVTETRKALPEDMPLIGFAGAPFTLASYAIEGGASRNYLNTKTLMYRDPGAWHELMLRFQRAITIYLNAQIAAGAQCVQLFDSWVGCLGPDDYRRYVLPYVQGIIKDLVPGVPVINFGTGNPALLPLYAEGGSQVVGVDWRVRLDEAWDTIGHNRSVQGNLEPIVLLAEQEEIKLRVAEVLDQAGGRPGHIFNLGHGVLQQTPVENAIAVVDMVHQMSSQ